LSKATFSTPVFAVFVVGTVLVVAPHVPPGIFGIASTSGVGIRVAGDPFP
jgi:hypothetical protein